MKKQNKFLYGFRVSVNYGAGFEYVYFSESLKVAKEIAKDYRRNSPEYPVKLSKAREINDDYQTKEN